MTEAERIIRYTAGTLDDIQELAEAIVKTMEIDTMKEAHDILWTAKCDLKHTLKGLVNDA